MVRPGCRYAVLIGDSIYFYDLSGMVGKMKKDGSGEKSLGTDTTSFLYVRHFCIFHTWNVFGQNTLVCASITDEIEIMFDIAYPVADGKWIYLTNEDGDSDYGPLWRINADNLKREPLSKVPCSLPFPAGDWLYVSCEDGIYRMNRDGTERTKVSDDHYTAINQAGEWLLFRSESTGQLMRMNPDGSGIKSFWGECS